jgi:osmoprotectant transport system ATP-binding protein
MIQVDNASKSYASQLVIDNVSMTVPRGETTVLIGPSGSGKSTLLSLFIGIEVPDTGSVAIDGEELTPQTAQRLRHKMGYVIQDGGLFPHLTARGNIELMAREAGWTKSRRVERLDELCSLTRFPEDGLDRHPVELSGGQRQRVSLMRALMLDPPIVLMDEPLGALDPMIRAELQDDLKSIFQSLGKTVLLVTHDLSEAAFLGNQIILLREGRVLQKGTFRDLVANPATAFVTRFVNAQLRRLGALKDFPQEESQ